jgi:DNA invertase Pin-like site-specific DNA recombinase
MSDDSSLPVVSYARISLDKRKDEHGVADQHRVNRAIADRLGWTVVHEFTDNDRPASRENVVRDEFEELLRVVRAGRLPTACGFEVSWFWRMTGCTAGRATTSGSWTR